MSRKLLIHAGFGKTGTSALQNFFVQNSRRLAAHNICYPAAGRNELDAHHYMATKARPGGGTGFESDRSWTDYVDELDRETRCFSDGTVLLSSEIFSGRMKWSMLTDFFPVFSEVSVILYLRRQDEIVMSSYQQWIKDGIYSVDYRDMDALPYFYDKSLEMWTNFLRHHTGDIIVRPFEKASFRGGSLFSDFMFHAFGIDDISDYSLPQKDASNLRLNETALEFKRCLNRICPEPIAVDLLSSLLNYSIDRQGAGHSRWDGSIFPPEKRRLMMRELFDEGNARIAREFMNRQDGVLFNEPLPADNENWAEPCLTEESLADILSYLLHLKYPGEEQVEVGRMIEGVFQEANPVKSAIMLIVRELYGQEITGEPINEPDPVVQPRLKEAIKKARSR